MFIEQRLEQLKINFSQWSRAAECQLIEQEFGLQLQTRSVCKYITRWGFTPQKPIKRACELSPVAVQAWLQGEYPSIGCIALTEAEANYWRTQAQASSTTTSAKESAKQRGLEP